MPIVRNRAKKTPCQPGGKVERASFMPIAHKAASAIFMPIAKKSGRATIVPIVKWFGRVGRLGGLGSLLFFF